LGLCGLVVGIRKSIGVNVISPESIEERSAELIYFLVGKDEVRNRQIGGNELVEHLFSLLP